MATGVRIEHDGMPALSMAGPVEIVVLAGGEAIEELRAADPAEGTRVRVEGRLHPSHADRPPGMTVERWSTVAGDG